MRRYIAAVILALVVLGTLAPAASAASASSRYFTYLGYQAKALLTASGIMDEIATDLDYYLIDDAITDLNRLYSHSQAAIKWHDKNKPHACYKSLWTYDRNAWVQYREAAASGKIAVRDLDFVALDDYKYHMDKATYYVNRGTAAMAKTKCV